MERTLTLLAALLVTNTPAAWFSFTLLGLPLPWHDTALTFVAQACAGVLVLLWTPAAAVITGWLTGRWTDGLLAAAPLPLVRLSALIWLFSFGAAAFSDPVQGPGWPETLMTVGVSLTLLVAADAFWSIVGSLLGATRMFHRPGWPVGRTMLHAAVALVVGGLALLSMPLLWVSLHTALDVTGLDKRAPVWVIGGLWASTLLPSLGLLLLACGLSRQPLAVPLGLATAGWLSVGCLVAMADARLHLGDALMAVTFVGPLLGVFAFGFVLWLGAVGTGVGRMARGERLFGRDPEGMDQTKAT